MSIIFVVILRRTRTKHSGDITCISSSYSYQKISGDVISNLFSPKKSFSTRYPPYRLHELCCFSKASLLLVETKGVVVTSGKFGVTIKENEGVRWDSGEVEIIR